MCTSNPIELDCDTVELYSVVAKAVLYRSAECEKNPKKRERTPRIRGFVCPRDPVALNCE